MSKSRIPDGAQALHQHIAAQLRLVRTRAGLSQIDAARAIGVSYQQYNKYELGANRISAVTLQCLAWFFDVPIAEFFTGSHSAPAPARARFQARMTNLCSEIEDRYDQAILLDLAAALLNRPRPDAHAGLDLEASRDRQALPADARHIMLVDDDTDALTTTVLMLRNAGIAVTTAANGDAALRYLAAGIHFDALVTDYAMPGLNGAALIELVHEIAPHLPTMIITGYVRDNSLHRLPHEVKILSKPYTRSALLNAIAALIKTPDQPPAALKVSPA